MIQIRRSIFETNSSSTHSISFTPKDELAPSVLEISEDGYIHTWLNEYGWDLHHYTSQEDRLSYLVTMLTAILGHDPWYADGEDLEKIIRAVNENEEFQQISKIIADYTGTKGIILDSSDGYIDHQSVYYSSLEEYLKYWKVNILEFVFGDTTVTTSNDNDYEEEYDV